ncbi:hypothetical protein ACFWCK_11195 [Microbacterium sp. NPDC060117]
MTAADVAEWAPRVGQSRYGVDSGSDWKVTAAPGTRNVQIAAGRGWGYGVVDDVSAPTVLALAAAVSGVRWWLIVAHRDWATGATDFRAIDAGATAGIPTRDETPGVKDDQPLALVRVGTGAAIAEIRDLRVVGTDGGAQVFDELALTYLTKIGTTVRLGNIEWHRYLDSTGAPKWEKRDITPDTGWVEGIRNGGWSWYHFQVRRIGGIVYGRASAARGVGWSPGNELGIIPVGFRPDEGLAVVNVWGGTGRGFNIGIDGRILADMASATNGVTIAWSYPAAG